MKKLALMRTAPASVTSAAEDKLITVTSLRNCKLTAPQIRAHIDTSQNSSQAIFQHQLLRGNCVNQAFTVEVLRRSHY